MDWLAIRSTRTGEHSRGGTALAPVVHYMNQPYLWCRMEQNAGGSMSKRIVFIQASWSLIKSTKTVWVSQNGRSLWKCSSIIALPIDSVAGSPDVDGSYDSLQALKESILGLLVGLVTKMAEFEDEQVINFQPKSGIFGVQIHTDSTGKLLVERDMTMKMGSASRTSPTVSLACLAFARSTQSLASLGERASACTVPS